MTRSAGLGLEVLHVGPGPDGGERYTVGEANVLQTRKTHLSISCPDRDPTWEEVAAARYALMPKAKDCVMILPPEDDYVNVHEHCFHVWRLRDLAPDGWAHTPENW